MGASGAESLNVAASIFMGQTEAPLTIRPFLPDLTQSELMTVMTSGMAHVSGGMMAAYIAFGVEAKHLLAAVIMTAPGTLLIAKMLVPETEKPLTAGQVQMAEMRARRATSSRYCARHGGRLQSGAQCRRHADFFSRADRICGWHSRRHSQLAGAARHGLVSVERAANFRLDLFAHRMAHRHSLA